MPEQQPKYITRDELVSRLPVGTLITQVRSCVLSTQKQLPRVLRVTQLRTDRTIYLIRVVTTKGKDIPLLITPWTVIEDTGDGFILNAGTQPSHPSPAFKFGDITMAIKSPAILPSEE